MRTSEELFQLIHSMDKSEKRYFKMFADRHTKKGQNNYILLFDAVSKQRYYDEESLLARFKGEAFSRHLASTKYQLCNLILKSLCAYNAGKSPDSELHELMESVKQLYNRGIYALCRKFLARAKNMAEEYERHYVLLELLNQERTMLFKWQSKHIERELNAILEHEKRIVEKIRVEAEYSHLYTRFVALRKVHSRVRSEDDSDRLNEILSHTLLQDIAQAHSFRSRSTYYRIHGQSSLIRGLRHAAYEHYHKLISEWESHGRLIENNLEQYKADLTNYLNACFHAGNFATIIPTLETLKSLPFVSPEDEVMTFQHVYFFELLHHFNLGELGRCEAVIAEIEKGMERYEGKLTGARLMAFKHNITIFYFISGKYTKTLEWLEKILSESNVELRQDIQDFARLLLLFVHYELRNMDVLESMIRSTYRYLHKRNTLYEYERTVLQFFRKLLDIHNPDRTILIFRELQSRLKELLEEEVVAKNVGLREVLFWVESKIENLPITEVFLRKMAENRRIAQQGNTV